MSLKIIVGADRALGDAAAVARELSLGFTEIALVSADRHNFDIVTALRDYPPVEHEVFVALDERAVNYARLKLIAAVRLAGYRSFNLVSPRAIVEDDVRLMGNVLVEAGSNVAQGCTLGMGSWLARQVVLEREVKLGSCVSLRSAVVLGEGVAVGTGTTLGTGSYAAAGSQLGRHCEWLLGGPIPAVLPDRSFHDSLMPEGARILHN